MLVYPEKAPYTTPYTANCKDSTVRISVPGIRTVSGSYTDCIVRPGYLLQSSTIQIIWQIQRCHKKMWQKCFNLNVYRFITFIMAVLGLITASFHYSKYNGQFSDVFEWCTTWASSISLLMILFDGIQNRDLGQIKDKL